MLAPSAILVVLVGTAMGSADAPKDAKDEKLTDEQFLIKAIECDHSEVERADLAKKRSDNAEVRKFAETLRSAHDECRKDMLKHAGDLKTAIVAGLSKEHKECMEKLGKLEGKSFDREYLQTVLDNHQKMIKLFQGEASDGKIDALRAHAKKLVPTLQDHRKQAQKLKDKIDS
jgi:putative membrane protein